MIINITPEGEAALDRKDPVLTPEDILVLQDARTYREARDLVDRRALGAADAKLRSIHYTGWIAENMGVDRINALGLWHKNKPRC